MQADTSVEFPPRRLRGGPACLCSEAKMDGSGSLVAWLSRNFVMCQGGIAIGLHLSGSPGLVTLAKMTGSIELALTCHVPAGWSLNSLLSNRCGEGSGMAVCPGWVLWGQAGIRISGLHTAEVELIDTVCRYCHFLCLR